MNRLIVLLGQFFAKPMIDIECDPSIHSERQHNGTSQTQQNIVNRLLHKYDFLVRKYPTVPRHTVFLFTTGNLQDSKTLRWALADDKALQVLYKDQTIHVFDRHELRIDGKNIFAIRPPEDTFSHSSMVAVQTKIDPKNAVCINVDATSKALYPRVSSEQLDKLVTQGQ